METLLAVVGGCLGIGIVVFSPYFRHLQIKRLAKKLGLQYTYTAFVENYSFRNFFSSQPVNYIKGKYKGKDVLIFENNVLSPSISDNKFTTSIFVDNQLKETINGFFTASTKTIQKHLESYL